MNHALAKVLLLAGLGLAVSSTASAADVVTLRFGTHLALVSPGVVEGANVFIKEAKALSNGTLNFELYPAEQAGKALQMFDLVKSGAVDIGDVASAYVSGDKLPLMGVWEVPGLAKSSCDVYRAMSKLGSPGGIIYESDFKPNGIRVLTYNAYPPYGPAASRSAITKIEDLKGLKLRTAGGLMELMVQKVGGVPVKMPSTVSWERLASGLAELVITHTPSRATLVKTRPGGSTPGIGSREASPMSTRWELTSLMPTAVCPPPTFGAWMRGLAWW